MSRKPLVAALPTKSTTPLAALPPPVKVMCATPLVTVLTTVVVTLLPQQDEAFGGSNVQSLPHSTVLLVAQETKSWEMQLVNSARKAVGDGKKPELVT